MYDDSIIQVVIVMKLLDKIALVLFSNIILIISLVLCTVIFGWVKLDIITLYLNGILQGDITAKISLGVLIAFILLAIKGIFFTDPNKQNEQENGILIQNENGKLFISKDTIQNLVSGVVKETKGAKDVSTKVKLTKDNFINIDVILFVEEDIVIKELTSDLQSEIKETVKKSMDVDIKEVNVTIKNIAPKQERKEEN